jgi:hypothetical protein
MISILEIAVVLNCSQSDFIAEMIFSIVEFVVVKVDKKFSCLWFGVCCLLFGVWCFWFVVYCL